MDKPDEDALSTLNIKATIAISSPRDERKITLTKINVTARLRRCSDKFELIMTIDSYRQALLKCVNLNFSEKNRKFSKL